MTKNFPYIVRCNDCDFASDVLMNEGLALNERDFHSFDYMHSVSIFRFEEERWVLVTELMGVALY